MSRKLSLAITLLALFSPPLANVADAGVIDNAGAPLALSRRSTAVENVQYCSFDDGNYCWYDSGWRGSG
jgi:hypothetical protein